MNSPVVIRVSRAPALIPCMLDAIRNAARPLILVPESFTLTTEQALVQSTETKGIIGTQVLSQTSLVREIRELAGSPDKGTINRDGRNMLLSMLLLKNRDRLLFYKENVNQISMAEKLANQIDDLADGGFSHENLESAAKGLKKSTQLKCHDIALIWGEYQKVLDSGYVDQNAAWSNALGRLADSGLMQGKDLLIFGFDYINMNLTRLIATAYPLAGSITVGLVSETGCDDDYIFEVASNSLKRFVRRMKREEFQIPVRIEPYRAAGAKTDPGVSFIEQTLYSMKNHGDPAEIPDLGAVSSYYASNTTVECQNTAQTLIRWHQDGIAWHEMAVAVCDNTTVPAMLPLVLSSAGIPYSLRTGIPMLLSEYAQFFLATLRAMRSGYRQEEVMKIIKSKFTKLTEDEMMDLENYAREKGIDRNRWLKPFPADDARGERLEKLRTQIMEPLASLRRKLNLKKCTGRQAAEALYSYMVSCGAYDTLLKRERELIEAGMLPTADRNRQVWSAVNELLDQLATFAAGDHISVDELCAMLESSVSSKMIKSLPQEADSVLISSPNMFFSSGLRAVAVIGLQDQTGAPPSALLTPAECAGLVQIDENGEETSGIGMTRREMAARAKQDIYQAVAATTERLLVSASAAQANGKVLVPAQVYRDVTATLNLKNPENVRGGLMNDELLPFVPQFALERLAVMLRAARDQQDSFLTRDDGASAVWRQALAYLYHDPYWGSKVKGVLDGLHVKVASPGIDAETAALLYGRDRLSVSAIQTAGTCLYWAFLSYGLRVRRREEFTFEADSEGTFSHEVLQRFFDEAIRTPGWPDLSASDVSALLDRILEEETKSWADGPLGKNMSGRFQGEELVGIVRTAVTMMADSLRTVPHFKPIGMEIGFGDIQSDSEIHLPEVVLTLDDGREIALKGKIDRIDTVELPDGRKAVMVYDYKSSDKEIHMEQLEAGLQIQLPIYLSAVRQAMPDHILAGALYQPIKQVLADAEDDDEEKIEKEIEKVLRAKGIYLNDEALQDAAKPLKIPRSTTSSDVISVLSPEGLQEVMDKSARSACRIISRMLAGNTTPNPLQGNLTSPCSYCGMADGCPLDSRLEGGQVRKLGSADTEED